MPRNRTLIACLAGMAALLVGLYFGRDSAGYTSFAGSIVALVGALAAKASIEHATKKN
jgi:hypothetical protein